MIRAERLHFRYRRSPGAGRASRDAAFGLEEVSFAVPRGSITGILGPNGAGKSTILKLLLKILDSPPQTLFLDNDDVRRLNQRALARRVAYVPQSATADQAFPVRELVAMGRYPHRSRLRWSTREDPEVTAALRRMELTDLADRPATSLSGGEFQRVLTARALAQGTPVILLDEPTNHLDLHHQLALLSLLHAERSNRELTVLAVFHDIQLALRSCDRVIVMAAGRVAGVRTPAQLLDEPLLEEVYGVQFDRIRLPAGDRILLPRLQLGSSVGPLPGLRGR